MKLRTSLATLLMTILLASSLSAAKEQQTLVQGTLDNAVFLAPDFKFTEVDGRFANLAGIYGGWLIDRKLLLGGGGYYLTNRSDDLKMTYGGLVVEYFVRSDRLVNFSIKGLVGGGEATLASGLGRIMPLPLDASRNFNRLGGAFTRQGYPFPGDFPSFPVRLGDLEPIEEGFFIIEPEASVMLNITEAFRLGFGGGYRFVGAAGRVNDRLEGLTANVSLKFAF